MDIFQKFDDHIAGKSITSILPKEGRLINRFIHESREPSRPNQQPLLMLLATPRFLIDLTFSRNSQSQGTKPSQTAKKEMIFDPR